MGGGGTPRMMTKMPDYDNDDNSGGGERSYGSNTMLTMRERNPRITSRKEYISPFIRNEDRRP